MLIFIENVTESDIFERLVLYDNFRAEAPLDTIVLHCLAISNDFCRPESIGSHVNLRVNCICHDF